jgi:hypothetical protein
MAKFMSSNTFDKVQISWLSYVMRNKPDVSLSIWGKN